MENAAPLTTLCGQLAALKTQPLHVRVKKKSKSLSQEQSSKHVRARRENTCVLAELLARRAPGPYLAEWKHGGAGRAAMTAARPESGRGAVGRKQQRREKVRMIQPAWRHGHGLREGEGA